MKLAHFIAPGSTDGIRRSSLNNRNFWRCSPRPLIDPFARAITYLRVSVTDRCDFRCVYCMSEHMTFLPKADLLRLEELDRLCSAFIANGVRKLRLTGGEPLVRRGIMTLFARCRATSRRRAQGTDADHQRLATRKYAAELKAHGVERINVSLDTLDPDKFRAITRWGDLDKVMAGHRCRAGGRAQGQDQRGGAEGRKRRRNRRPDGLGAWPRHGSHPDRGHAARRHR